MRLRDYLPKKLKRPLRRAVDETLPLAALHALLYGRCRVRDGVAVAGTPRSGTTWLAQVLSEIPGSAVLLEPIQPTHVPESERAGFSWRTHVPPDADWPEGERYLLRVFRGKVLNKWTTREISVRRALSTRSLIVKFVRANRLLSWLCRRLPIRSAAMIIRHPCAVVASQLRGSWANAGPCHGPECLADYPALQAFLSRLDTQAERLAATWAMDYFIPFAEAVPRRWQLVTYERLVLDYDGELQRLFGAWNMEIPRNVARQFSKPSITTQRSGISGLAGWQQQLDKEQVRRILAVAAEFGLDFYGEDVEPDYDRLYSPALSQHLRGIGAQPA